MKADFIVHNVVQRSPEWFALRAGRLTGSVADDMTTFLKSGNESAARRDLRLKLATERLIEGPMIDDYISPEMQWGMDRESEALARYESVVGNLANTVGFISHPTLLAGASLDAYLGDYEVVTSLKCPKSTTHYRYLRTNGIPPDYVPQMLHELWLTGAEEYHFVSYDPRFPDWSLQLLVVKVPRNENLVEEYRDRALAFLKEIEDEVAGIKKTAALNSAMRAVRP
jgi:hypothetical protein